MAVTLQIKAIGQSQSSNQNALCVSGEDATVSCNNANFQNQVNSGNNVLGQLGLEDRDNSARSSGRQWQWQGSGSYDGKYGGNSATQAIEQIQQSNQRSSVISGGNSFLSGNNLNVQNQENSGDNTAGQSGGDYGSGGNSAEQEISQSQSSNQRSSVISGGDSVASGNNINVQNQENSGDNTAVQSGGNGNSGNSADQGISQAQASDDNDDNSGDERRTAHKTMTTAMTTVEMNNEQLHKTLNLKKTLTMNLKKTLTMNLKKNKINLYSPII